MALTNIKKRIAVLLAAFALVTGGVTAGSVATAPPAAAATYGPVVNVKMGPYSAKWKCEGVRWLSIAQGHVTGPCFYSSGNHYFYIYRFLFV
ncbi:hypothetical protein ACFQ36_05920 [Arthrobacter sp. GCM10027362]|uniref:hypothetical protein n=1 Tax=Arthrobacter sp. GCM10027362 TaxID=3273379 RepID=UPI00362FD0DE